MEIELNASNLITGYADKFINYQLAELVADFALPLPVFRGRELHVLTTISEISSVFFHLRRDANQLGMTDFRGKLSHCVMSRQNSLHLSVDWTYYTPCRKNHRGTSVNYFVSNQTGQPIIEMVEIFPCENDAGSRKDLHIKLPSSAVSLGRYQNSPDPQFSQKNRTIH